MTAIGNFALHFAPAVRLLTVRPVWTLAFAARQNHKHTFIRIFSWCSTFIVRPLALTPPCLAAKYQRTFLFICI